MSKQELVEKIRFVAWCMADLAVDMDHFGGFNQRIADKAREMYGAAQIAREWADGIEAEGKDAVDNECDT